MSSLSTHLKIFKHKNPWYVEHYGLKHVMTEANYRAEFEQLGIQVIEERFHTKDYKRSFDIEDRFCFPGLCDHWHYIIDVPTNILVKAYNRKQNWAKILGIDGYIIRPPKTECIKFQERYEDLKNFLSYYPVKLTMKSPKVSPMKLVVNDDEDEYSETYKETCSEIYNETCSE